MRTNLSAALATAGRLDEAKTEASGALKLDSQNARAHFVMAAILLRQNGHMLEAIPHLAAAQEAFPNARTALEKLCAMKPAKGCPAE
jgi:tetratricopeptide (TPR) repeat protein